MIEILGAILFMVGVGIAVSAIFTSNFKIAVTLIIIGAVIMFIGGGLLSSTSQCHSECGDRNLIFSHQEYNHCSEELTCYCKQPITSPKPKVVIIE